MRREQTRERLSAKILENSLYYLQISNGKKRVRLVFVAILFAQSSLSRRFFFTLSINWVDDKKHFSIIVTIKIWMEMLQAKTLHQPSQIKLNVRKMQSTGRLFSKKHNCFNITIFLSNIIRFQCLWKNTVTLPWHLDMMKIKLFFSFAVHSCGENAIICI